MIPYKHCEWRWITVTACPAGWVPDWLVHVASLLRLQYCSSNRHVLSQRFLCRRRSVNFNVTPPRRVCLLRAFFVARVTSRLKMVKCPVNHQIYEWRMSGVCLSRITCRSQSNQMVCSVPIFTLELVLQHHLPSIRKIRDRDEKGWWNQRIWERNHGISTGHWSIFIWTSLVVRADFQHRKQVTKSHRQNGHTDSSLNSLWVGSSLLIQLHLLLWISQKFHKKNRP